jgi:dihydropteroate synthase
MHFMNCVSNFMATTPLTLGNLALTWGARTYVMGVLNLTTDSFSGDGLVGAARALDPQALVNAALEQARRFVASGADLLDVGAESTRPGSEPVAAEVEIERVVPVIQALSGELEAPISIDTYKAPVAGAALDAGASLINDVWGLRADPDMARLAAERNAPVILMHNRSKPADSEVRERLGGRYVGVQYEDLLGDIRRELLAAVEVARAAGIPEKNIILDPGIGFGKTVGQNLELINRLDEIRALGYPVLLGASRKSFIGYTLDLPPDQRLEGTAAAVAVGIVRGADIVRVHDVEALARVARMTDALVRRSPPPQS